MEMKRRISIEGRFENTLGTPLDRSARRDTSLDGMHPLDGQDSLRLSEIDRYLSSIGQVD